MSAALQIKLFGPPAVTLNGQAVMGFISNKATATIFYLAATGQPQARDVLAALLWSNSPEFYAKKNLRNVLSNLRDLLGNFLEISRETVSLQLHAGDRVDSADFAVRLTQATKLPEKSSARNTLLAEAISLYHGPFLDGFHIADADTFDEWLRAEREHYQRLAIQALNELVVYHAHQGELLTGMAYATRLLALDPLSEETHRHLMLLLALDGQTSAAMAHYRACQKLLQAELGVQPAPETQQLYARILAGEFSKPTSTLSGILPIAPVVPRPRLTLPAELTSFIGREAEIAKIERQLAEPTCRLITIIGMGGVGKTRMALRIAHLNAEFGMPSAESPQAIPHSALPTPHFIDGIGFVSLAALEANDQIAHQLATAIAASLQLPLTGSIAPADQLIQALYDKELLLILDNCEHSGGGEG